MLSAGDSAKLIGSLGELAAMDGMPSEPTIRKMIDADPEFPVLSRGTHGRAWEFNLAEAWRYVRAVQEREEEEARARRHEINQLTLSLLGDDALGVAPAALMLSPSEQSAALQAELLRIKLAKERGELVRADEMDAALSEIMVWLAEAMNAMAAKCAKRLTFSREQLGVIDAVTGQTQIELADRMERVKQRAALQSEPATAAPVPAGV
jgi:phage terminase Nu1 subunit (DNA packaging protein)